MGSAGSKRTGSNSRETNNRTALKLKSKQAQNIVDKSSSSSLPKSPKRRRRRGKRAPQAHETNPEGADTTPEDAGGQPHSTTTTREAGKIETLVRGGVKSVKDWKMISSRGSRSAARLATISKEHSSSPINNNHSNQFNFHHASYLAQTKQEKPPALDFPSPRHLTSNSARLPHPEYVFPKNHNSAYEPSQHIKRITRQHTPDKIPPLSRYECRKDVNRYYSKTTKNSSQNSPNYLYSLELQKRSSVHIDEASITYVAGLSRAHSPDCKNNYKGSTLVEKPSRDNINCADLLYQPDRLSARYLEAYSTPADKEEMPIFLPLVPQEVVVQRVEVKPDLEYSRIKPKTIRVNGVDYVRKKSTHPLMKQLLTVDKNLEKVVTTSREKPERSNSRKASEREKQSDYIERHDRSKNHSINERGSILEKGDKEVDDNGQAATYKSHGRESETNDGNKYLNCGNTDDKNTLSKSQSGTKLRGPIDISTRDKRKGDVSKSNDIATHEKERKETEKLNKYNGSTTNIDEKKDNQVISEKNDKTKQSYNSRSREAGKRENASPERDKKETETHEKRSNTIEKKDNKGRKCDVRLDEKLLSKADQELLRQCRIKHMPVAVSSTGRLFLPSMKFMATPLAAMVDNHTTKLTACASESSKYSRKIQLSPHRLKLESMQRQTCHSPKPNASRKLAAEPVKDTSNKTSDASKENFRIICRTAANGSITISTQGQNTSPGSNSLEDKTNVTERACPKVNMSKHELGDSLTANNNEPKSLKVQKQTEQTGDGDGYNLETSFAYRAITTSSQGEMQTDIGASPKESFCSNVDSKSSHKSMDASWYSKSVRSKNKIFETIIERSSSLITHSEHHRTSRTSSPHSQSNDTPFSKAIKHKYHDISAKRLSRPELIGDRKPTKISTPNVFTPWDSCMMFKPGLTHPPLPPYNNSTSQLHTLQSEASRTQQISPKQDINHTQNDGSTSIAVDRNPIIKELCTDMEQLPPPQTYKVVRVLHESKFEKGCSCELAVCHCAEVKESSGRRETTDDPKPRCEYSKLNREKVIDFEKKFQNTHVYRSVTGKIFEVRELNKSCRDNHGRPVMANKGSMDRTKTVSKDSIKQSIEPKRQKRCLSCGKRSNRAEARCTECCEPLDKSSSTDSGEEEVTTQALSPRCSKGQHDSRDCTLKCCDHCGGGCGAAEEGISGNGSSSGLSARSGQVPPYKKVLKMFETKSKTISEHASRHKWPPSERMKAVAKPALRFTYHNSQALEEFPLPRSPRRLPDQHARDVIIQRRRHRILSSPESEEEERNDPHFNHSEQELFRNARLQWMAMDQKKRPRQHLHGIRSAHYTTTSSTWQKEKKHRPGSPNSNKKNTRQKSNKVFSAGQIQD